MIDDSPTPEPSALVLSGSFVDRSITERNNRQSSKKRRRNDIGSAYDPVYHADPSNRTPECKDSPASTISNGRTTSVAFTTAATSLGSLSSNGQNNYTVSSIHSAPKRKRTATRLQIANEAKRKELEANGDAFINYRPPPRPPIKAPDVKVKQVTDVGVGSHIGIKNTHTRYRTYITGMEKLMIRMVTTSLYLRLI